jgi:hypothetical protein
MFTLRTPGYKRELRHVPFSYRLTQPLIMKLLLATVLYTLISVALAGILKPASGFSASAGSKFTFTFGDHKIAPDDTSAYWTDYVDIGLQYNGETL